MHNCITPQYRSRGYSTLFVLSRSDLESALEYHEEAAQILRLRADRIIRENAARQAMKAYNQLSSDSLSKEESIKKSTSGIKRRSVSSVSLH